MDFDAKSGIERAHGLISKFNFAYVLIWHLLWEAYKTTFTIPDLDFYYDYIYHLTGIVPVLCVFIVIFLFERVDIGSRYTKYLSRLWIIVQFVPFNSDSVSSPVKIGVFALRLALYMCIVNCQTAKPSGLLPFDSVDTKIEGQSLFLAAWVFFVPIPYLVFAVAQIFLTVKSGDASIKHINPPPHPPIIHIDNQRTDQKPKKTTVRTMNKRQVGVGNKPKLKNFDPSEWIEKRWDDPPK